MTWRKSAALKPARRNSYQSLTRMDQETNSPGMSMPSGHPAAGLGMPSLAGSQKKACSTLAPGDIMWPGRTRNTVEPRIAQRHPRLFRHQSEKDRFCGIRGLSAGFSLILMRTRPRLSFGKRRIRGVHGVCLSRWPPRTNFLNYTARL